MNRKMYIMAIIAICSVLLATAPEEVKSAARSGYKDFIQVPLRQPGFCADHGISEKDLKSVITLGQPYQLRSMAPEHIRGYIYGVPVGNISEKTNIYMFPVLFDGQPKLLLDVCDFGTGCFEIGSLGQSWLCRELNDIESTYAIAGDQPLQLIQNYQTGRYLVHIPKIDQKNLIIVEPCICEKNRCKPLPTVELTMERMNFLLDEVLN